MCLNYNNNITVASFTGATAMTRVSTSGQCTYLYKVRQTPKDTRTGCQLFQSTYLYKVRPSMTALSTARPLFQSTYLYKVRRRPYYGYSYRYGFNPRTYIRYDFLSLHYPVYPLQFQSTYLYKVRLANLLRYCYHCQVSIHVPI